MTTFDMARLAELFGNDVVHDDGKSSSTLAHRFENEDFLRGHFPDFPVVPGVILLDGMMLAGMHNLHRAAGRAAADLRSIAVDAVTFHRPVLPGQPVEFTARCVERDDAGSRFVARCAVMAGSVRHARAGIVFRFDETSPRT